MGMSGQPTMTAVLLTGRSAWRKRWTAFAGRYADHPLFRRLSSASSSAAARGRDAAEDLRERWETSDSPLMHRIQVGSGSVAKKLTEFDTAAVLSCRSLGATSAGALGDEFLRPAHAGARSQLQTFQTANLDSTQQFPGTRCPSVNTGHVGLGAHGDGDGAGLPRDQRARPRLRHAGLPAAGESVNDCL